MGLKDYYEKAKSLQALSNKSAAEIGEEVESAAYHTEDIIREERFIPRVNFKYPKNFARYGSAEEYYAQSLRRIYEDYPYDGSLRERLEWENQSTYLDLHVFENEYPRTNGYINISAGEWGTVSAKREGYGLPSDVEYIFLKGGPHVNPDGMSPYSTQLTGANYYETALNRSNNLQFDLLSKGATVEFWMKKDAFDLTKTEKEVIFDLWNGNTSGSGNYGRFRLELTGASGADCFRATVLSGGYGFEMQSVADSTLTSEAVADGTWHHYALTMMSASNGVLTNFYLDGNLNRSQVLGSSMDLNEVTGALRANIGALISSPASSSAAQYSGKLSASLDEFRYWKTERSGKEIGRHWFTQMGGGTNNDPEPFKTTLDKVNTDLGVYYKFNEGITGVAATDSVVLDYSGRISNGSWTGYSSASRATGSAIVLSNAATKEFKDPIIYAFHPEVSALATRMRLTGSSYDVTNNAAIYNTIPAWITEEDNEGQRQLKQLVQIMSSYFDTLHLQVESLPSLGNINYASGSHKPLPFADRLVSSAGLAVPELFIDADIIEKLADRSEDRIYEKSLADIKNTIYQNIYNNLVYIYKTKGTEKSFRNLIRCFGIDDDLVKLNMYGDGIEYEVRENRRTVSVVDKFVDFNTSDNTTGTVYQSQGTDTTNTKGYLPTLSASATGFAQTLEADILFPLKPDEDASFYYNTNTVSASLFGVHAVHNNENYTTWATSPADSANFQVYAVRDEITSDSVRFVLTGTAGTCVPWSLASDLYENVYDNTYWNLAVRIKPLNYPQAGQVLGAPTSGDINNYTIELHGVQLDAGAVRNEFNLAATVEGAPGGFVTGSKRAFIGAHRTNFTGSIREYSDVKVNACRYWYDYLEDDVLVGHAYDTQNYGSLYPNRYAFPFNASASFGEVLQSDTLVFNWEFAENTGSNASGQFSVADESSGSIDTAARFDALGDILGYQYPAQGYGFLESSTKVVDKDHVISSKLQLPENVHSSDMITVMGAQEQQVFTRDSRPVNYFFAFEKSMAQALSVEMINYFATLKDIHNIIGAPVNRYRPEYKGLKVLRQRFFERVSNSEIDFEKFYEFYKWFDSSLTMMLQQLVPASADFAENVRTVIESHMLERSKYQHKIQNVKQQSADPEGALQGNSTQMPQGGSPEDNPPGTGFFSANAATRRQIGTSQPINFKNWKFIHAPAPEQGESFSPTDKNSIWWQSEAARNTIALVEDTPSADPGLLKNKQTILANVKATNKRAQQASYKFGVEGNSTLGGVGFGINKKTDFVFVATTPFGSIRNGAAENIMVGFRREVEELMNTKDVYHPAFKQRLGFQLNPDINRNNNDLHKGDGNLLAPFSIYSSSVTTGQNLQVIQNYAPEIEITNLHHDIVHDSDTPLQGPFTEKFVGGRQYRHTEINEGSDNARYRAEGWKIKFDKVLSKDGADFETPMIGIVPPNYDAGAAEGFDKDVPTAHRLRNVGAKRPLNIQNIKMTTASLGSNLPGTLAHGKIGNYQKNYEVVQTSGRTQNDFYFNDQSFDFARYPETLATRGRFPLTPQERKSVHFQDNDYIEAGVVGGSDWEAAIGGTGAAAKPVSFSMWLNADSLPSGYPVFKLGDASTPNYELQVNSNKLKFIVRSSGTNPYVFSSTLTAGIWYHVVVTLGAGTGEQPNMYINGTLDNGSRANTTNNVAIADTLRIGDSALAFDGYICDFAVWSKELSATEVSTIYSAGGRINLRDIGSDSRNGGLNPTPNGLLAWYPLGDDSGDTDSGTIYDQMGFANGTPTNFNSNADSGISTKSPPYAAYGSLIENPRGDLDYELPTRTGTNSNQSVIVNRFSAGGAGYEVDSPGYMDPAHEEMSVYNVSPYRSPRTLNFGNTGSLGQVYGALSGTIQVRDQLGRPRGLRQLSRLHSGKFGADAVFGEVVPQTYVTVPSYHKVNRNSRSVIKEIQGHAAYFSGSFAASPVYPDEGDGPPSGAVGRDAEAGSPEINRIPTMWGPTHTFYGTQASLSIWIYLDASSPNWGRQDYHYILSSAGAAQKLYIDSSTNQLHWRVRSYIGNRLSASIYDGDLYTSALETDTWNHITLTKMPGYNSQQAIGPVRTATDPEFMKIYVNGTEDWTANQVLIDQNSGYAPQSTFGSGRDPKADRLIIGNVAPLTASYPFCGYMSELMIWSERVLTKDDTARVYNGGIVADITDPTMFKNLSEAEARKNLHSLNFATRSYDGLVSSTATNWYTTMHARGTPQNLLVGLDYHYRFHQFAGSQIGGTDPSDGYSDSPTQWDPDDPWNTAGVLNIRDTWVTGAYTTTGEPYLWGGNWPDAGSAGMINGLYSIRLNGLVQLQSEVSPRTVERQEVYDNLYVQHPIPRSIQQYSWVTASVHNPWQDQPLNIPPRGAADKTIEVYDLQKPTCFSPHSLAMLAQQGTTFKGSQNRYYQVGTHKGDQMAADYDLYHTDGCYMAMTGTSDNLLFKNRTPGFSPLNTMLVDPVDVSGHILGATTTEGSRVVPTFYEAAPAISNGRGMYFGTRTTLAEYVQIGNIWTWDQMIGTGSANANKMSWTWWMKQMGPAVNQGGLNDGSGSLTYLVQFGDAAATPGAESFRSFFIGLDTGQPIAGTLDPETGASLSAAEGKSYLTLHANTFSTTSGSWVVTNPSGGPTITEGKWYHVTMTYDAGNVGNDPVFYVNGVKYSTSNNGVSCYVRPTGSYNGLTSLQATRYGAMLAGGRGNRSGWGLRGYLADVAVWNIALSDDEATGLYNNGNPVNIKRLLPKDIRAWYIFSRGAGDTDDKIFNRALPTAVSQSEAIYTISGFNANDPIVGTAGGYLIPNDTTARPGLQSSASLPGISDLKTFEFDYAVSFNTLNLGRNGPYGHPTWKQIRTGEHKVARQLRKENKIGVLIPPAPAESRRGLQYGKQANKFVDYTEMPAVYDTAKPIEFIFEDLAGGNKDNDLRLKVSYQNNMDYFSNQGLNNRLSLGERIRPDVGNAFNAAADYLFDSNLSAVIKYGQKIYPAETNTGQKRIRTREAYKFDDVWNEVRKHRSIQIPPKPNSQGFYDPGESMWPLDAPMALTHSPDNPAQQADYPPGGLRGLVVQGGGIMPGGQTADSIDPAGYLGSQAGELMNTYARFGIYSQKGVSSITASLAYIMPSRNGVLSTGSVSQARGNGLLFGYQRWTAFESASMPYKPYEGYMENVQKLGKNMSVIPEFRISDHLERYIEDEGGDFQADVNNLFSVTGAIQADSANEDFYKVYSTSDFMKYFKIVDKQLANKTTAAGAQLKRYSIELSCDALMQFLPYKGFYPAERTVELGRLLSQSLGPIGTYPSTDTNWSGAQKITKRILLEPLMAPGILFNTIKSGIACSSLVLVGGNGLGLTASVDHSSTASYQYGNGGYADSNLDGSGFMTATAFSDGTHHPFYNLRIVSSGSKDLYGTNFYGQPIPFEAIRDPDVYLSMAAINRKGDQESLQRRARMYLYDTGLGSASLGNATTFPGQATPSGGPADGSTPRILYRGNSASPLYKLGIDNFLCETMNFFQQPLKSFVSKPEEEFLSVEKNQYYGMRVKLARTSLTASQALPLEKTFGMYSRDAAFGPPVQLRGTIVGDVATSYPNPGAPGTTEDAITYEPWLPPHWYGSCEANIIFKAPYSGKVTLDEILGNKVTEFSKISADKAMFGLLGTLDGYGSARYTFQDFLPGYDVVRPQVTSSVDIFEKLLVVPPDTNTQQARWLIQPKFEAPILNFFGVPASASATQGVGLKYPPNTNSPIKIDGDYTGRTSVPKIRGMWHQYGKQLSGSEGIHLSVENLPTQYSSSTYGGIIDVNPLTEIVGIPTSTKRIGNFADAKTVEEAIVCVPFITVKGNRKFFNVEKRSQEYVTQLALLNKYVFPPTMDFLKNDSVKPFAFYAFEFNLQFTQKDLMDIWQNCAPTKASAFQKSNATIKIRSLVDKMLENKEELQWMVFKVKRKAEKDYSVFTKKGLTEGLPIVQESLDSPYSYNWPYDYFSFVELVKIDESVTYATDDIIPEDEEEDVIMPDLREFIPAPKELGRAIAPPPALLREVEEGIPTEVIRPETPPRGSAGQARSPDPGSRSTTRSTPRRQRRPRGRRSGEKE